MSLQLTARVTGWWAGRDNTILSEPTPSRRKRLKTRTVPTSEVHAVLGRSVGSVCHIHRFVRHYPNPIAVLTDRLCDEMMLGKNS